MSGHSATRRGEYEIFEGKIVPPLSAAAVDGSGMGEQKVRISSVKLKRRRYPLSVPLTLSERIPRSPHAVRLAPAPQSTVSDNCPTDRSNDGTFIRADTEET
jgi:hypothetical protein